MDADVPTVLRILWGQVDGQPNGITATRRAGPRYAMLPRAETTKALVPSWPPSVTAAVVRNYITPRTRAERRRASILELAARLGVFSIWPHSTRVRKHVDAGLLSHLAQLLARDVVAGIFLGPRRVNRKPVLQLVTADGELVAYVKVGITDFTRQRLTNEAAALRHLGGLQLRTMTVPQLLAAGDWEGDNFIVLSPVQTRSTSAPQPHLRRAAMAELSRSTLVETRRLVDGEWWHHLMAGLVETDGGEARQLRDLAAQVAHHRGDRLLELGTAHGDWSPWNMATADDRIVVWDWERLRFEVPIGWDAVHYATELNRQNGARDGEGLRRMLPHLRSITEGCGSETNDPELVFATYLLDLAQRYLEDSRLTGVQPRGPLSHWLLGPLTDVVSAMSGRAGT